ncbi:MAG: exopolysaccharide biosynthesis polyprenyl glycosylphosphotransferase [Clostridia bacterium]|nr:exopolysaccharide biosynthesis polyprenyl glycosylphosphotransferase [Clostridia bacterium]
MYKKRKTGWVEHFDFKLIDVIAALTMFILIIVRHHSFTLSQFVSSVTILVLFILLFDIMTDMHSDVMYRGVLKEFMRSVWCMVVCCGVILIYTHFIVKRPIGFESEAMFVLASICVDYIVKVIYKELVKKGLSVYNRKRKMILIAMDDNIEDFVGKMQKYSFGQIEITGIVLIDSQKYSVGDSVMGYKYISEINELPDFLLKRWIDEVIMNLPSRRAPRDVIAKLTEMGITTHRVIDFHLHEDNNKMVETFAGYTCLTESVRIMQSTSLFAKRIVDIIGGIIGSLITVLLMVIVGPIIFITDPGPIFFAQPRIGKGGRVFKMLKFRSMYKDAEARKAELMQHNTVSDGMMFKMDNDPRILGSGPNGTRKGIGWFIRKFSIDEFPQFFNVLWGDMSLVGTRPPTLDEWEKYGSSHRARMAIRPGITGMWQTSGRSDITDFEEVIKLDMEYIRNMSVIFDLKLIFKTVRDMLRGGSGAK